MNAKWKRLVTAILMMALLLGPIVSMQTPARAADGEDDNTFIVGFDAEFPPYGYKDDNGEYVGFDLDLAQEVCDRNGWTLKKQPIEWNSKDMELNSGSISCIWNGFTMNGREDDYTWTKPYVDNSQVVVVRKDSGITQLNDLSGKVVAVQADSSALAALTGEDASEENKALCATFKDLQQVGDYNSAFMNLESGAVDAICMDIGVANYEIESRGDKFMMLEDRLSSEEYGIGFKKGNTELRDKVQATLLDMLADGTFDEIAEKWGLEESICLTADDEVQEETAADDNTFVVGFDAEFPPYGYKNDDGEYVGFDLDLAQEVCDRNGWILKKQPIEWNSKDMELNSGSISCIWNGFTMNGREDAYTWTTPYVDNSQVVVVRKDSGITQLTDLSGKVVAVQADSSALAALTGEDASEENKALAETFKELQQVGDYNSAFMNLESGAVNAICMDIGVANYEIESRGDKFMMLEDRLPRNTESDLKRGIQSFVIKYRRHCLTCLLMVHLRRSQRNGGWRSPSACRRTIRCRMEMPLRQLRQIPHPQARRTQASGISSARSQSSLQKVCSHPW